MGLNRRPALSFPATYTISAAALAWFLVLLGLAPDATILVPDSQSYLNFFSFRSAGYPMFLRLAGAHNVIWVQPLLAAVSLGYLAGQVSVLSRSTSIAMVVMLLIIANYRFNIYHYTVFTESLYMSVLMLILGAWIKYMCDQRAATLVLLSCLIGIAISIRPSAAFLPPLVLFFVWLAHTNDAWRSRFKHLCLALLPAILIASGERMFTYAWHDANVTSLFGRHMYAKAALIDGDHAATDRYGAALDSRFQPVRRFIDAAPNFSVKNHFLPHYEICIQYACSADLGLEAGSVAAKDAAIARIGTHPLAFIELALFNYRSLWTIYNSASQTAARDINQYLAQSTTMPFADNLEWLRRPVVPQGAVKSLPRLFVWLIGILSFLTILHTLYRWITGYPLSRIDNVRAFCAFGLHGALALTALTGVSVPRYLIVLWPLLIVYTVLFYPCMNRFSHPLNNNNGVI